MKTRFTRSNDVFQGVNEGSRGNPLIQKMCAIFSILADINKAARSDYEDYSILSNKQQMLRECRLFFYQDNTQMMKQIEEFSKNIIQQKPLNGIQRIHFFIK